MPSLTLDHLDKSFGTVRALHDLSFDVAAGEIFGFVGSNGAGKSTAMRIVLGVLASDSGDVLWDGSPIDYRTRRCIGYMPEERGLYPRMKVSDQLTYLARLHGMDAVAARRSMEHWTEVLGIDGRRGDEILKLSLGNQQRVQLAAALVHEPVILVLDEPFSGLDPVAVDVMSGVLREQAAAGVPVMFSSHQLDLVERLCDRVGIIQAGEMVAVGDIDALRDTNERRWLIDATPPDAWLASVPGARVVETDGTRTVVDLSSVPTADADQTLLAQALGAGPVREFTRQRPSLVDLYRDVVAVQAEEEAS